jgi:hypothetical protein
MIKNPTNKNPAAVALGRLGGLAGKGVARPKSGFGNPEVQARALATIAKGRAERAKARAATESRQDQG